jgi:hypothetical protein
MALTLLSLDQNQFLQQLDSSLEAVEANVRRVGRQKSFQVARP